MLNWFMVYTKNLQMDKICNLEPFKGRLIDGFIYSLFYAKNPFFFAPFPIDWFEHYDEASRTVDFKLQWKKRNRHLIWFWILLVFNAIFVYLAIQSSKV